MCFCLFLCTHVARGTRSSSHDTPFVASPYVKSRRDSSARPRTSKYDSLYVGVAMAPRS